MISIKAISALGLTGLGAATMGTDVYLAHRAPLPPAQSVVLQAPRPLLPEAPPMDLPEATPEAEPTLQLPPVTVYARSSARHVAPAPARQLAACSNWRTLDNGPETRGVRSLCMTDVPVNVPQP